MEGYGEVSAAPELIRRICQQFGLLQIEVKPGYRVPRSELANPGKLSKILEAAFVQYRPDAIVVLFDADDDCPKDLVKHLQSICDDAPVKAIFVAANREYEAWFLGAIPSLRGHSGVRADAETHPNPEAPRNAKGELESRMVLPYSETLHQRKFSALLDLNQAFEACRSFRRLYSQLEQIITAS